MHSGDFGTKSHCEAIISSGKSENASIFGGTVVLSAADSNRLIAGGNHSSTKNPFPTMGGALNSNLAVCC